jgi:transposase
MITIGIDAHKRTHTAVAVDELGRQLGTKTTQATTTADHLAIIRWADRFGAERTWAVEDCRHLSRRLERDMLAAGETIVRVPTKLMANARDAARTYGKSDPIDALAVARAALREPDLPAAHLDDDAREIRLLVDHREDLVAERTRHINRVRWHFHEIDPAWEPKARGLTSFKNLDLAEQRLSTDTTVIARIALDLIRRIRELTVEINALAAELDERTKMRAPHLRRIHGVAALGAAKLIAEVAGAGRFKSRHAFARHNGTAPLPVWSGNRERHRLSRTGNRQLNAAIHRIALTQARHHPDAIAFLARRTERGDTSKEAVRALKRRLSDIVYKAILVDLAVSAADAPRTPPLAAA